MNQYLTFKGEAVIEKRSSLFPNRPTTHVFAHKNVFFPSNGNRPCLSFWIAYVTAHHGSETTAHLFVHCRIQKGRCCQQSESTAGSAPAFCQRDKALYATVIRLTDGGILPSRAAPHERKDDDYGEILLRRFPEKLYEAVSEQESSGGKTPRCFLPLFVRLICFRA